MATKRNIEKCKRKIEDTHIEEALLLSKIDSKKYGQKEICQTYQKIEKLKAKRIQLNASLRQMTLKE